MKNILSNSPRLRSYLFLALVLGTYACIGCLLLKCTMHGTSQGMILLERQIRSLMISLLVSAGVFALPIRPLKRMLLVGGVAIYASLWGLFLFGARLNGCFGWYKFGNLCIQPAEIAKPFFILALAMFCLYTRKLRRPYLKLPLLLAFIGLVLLPIVMQPDLGTAFILAVTFFLVIWCDGVPTKHMLVIAALGLLAAGFAYWHYPHLRRRVDTFVQNMTCPSQPKGYHAQKLQECLVKGGWTGNLIHHQDALHPLPYRYSDSLFAGTVELIGAVGAIPIIILCLAWFYYAYRLVLDNENHFLRLTILGAAIIITTQTMLHIAVNLGLFPNTGIPLPLLSYGGSSLLSTFLIVSLAIRFQVEAKIAKATAPQTTELSPKASGKKEQQPQA